MHICQFSVNFSPFKVDICFGKAQNSIIPFQNQCLLLSTASRAQPDNSAPTEKLTPHEHANAWRDRRSALPHYKMRGKILIRQSEFDAWIEQFRVNQGDAVKDIVRDVMSSQKSKKSDTGLIEKPKTE
jgi:hypothetical protein